MDGVIALVNVGKWLKRKRVKGLKKGLEVLLFVVMMMVAFVKADKTRQKQQSSVHTKPSDAGDCDAMMPATRMGGLGCHYSDERKKRKIKRLKGMKRKGGKEKGGVKGQIIALKANRS